MTYISSQLVPSCNIFILVKFMQADDAPADAKLCCRSSICSLYTIAWIQSCR
jgi:hypothetical protein